MCIRDRVCIVESEYNIMSTTVDDIFHFVDVIMHRGYLTAIAHHNFLSVWFVIFYIVDVAVTDCDQCKSQSIEVAFAVVCYIPSKFAFTD